MKLAARARYALRAMMIVAREGDDGNPINLGQVAKQSSISRRYLEQVAISLKNAGLLKAVSGKKGGHLLTRPAQDIMLDEIIEATIGPINIVDCIADPEACMMLEGCECRALYVLINQKIKESFNAFTLADLADHRIEGIVEKEIFSEPDK
jgi:Rrf2 family protein